MGNQCLRHCRRRLFLLPPRGRGRNARWLARRLRARRCPRCPLRMPPCRRERPQLERLGRHEGGDGRRHPVSEEMKE
jgi:hypothetical protein